MSLLKNPFIHFFILLSLLGPTEVWSQESMPEISVTAQRMEYLADGTLVAAGEVLVQGEGVTVKADSLVYDPGSDVLKLSGNIIMVEDGGGSFKGDALVLDLEDLTGGISRGEIIIVPNGFRVRGENINRMGPDEYSIQKGVFTSCPGDCPDWSFTASKIQIRKEGYLEARHAAFRIVGIPVFYTPYLLYPVKTKRQTGLLFPELSFSDETGIESRWPVFITLGPYADVTVSPRSFSRDSLGLDLESRYRLDWGGGGSIEGFTMTGGEPDRWFTRARHSMALMPDLWLRWRWYDTGDPSTPSLFGNDFGDRYPGALYRHITVEGEHGILGYSIQSSSLLTDGTLAGSDMPGIDLERGSAMIGLGLRGGDLLRTGIRVHDTRFENGERRTLVNPAVNLLIPGPWMMAGYLKGQAIIGTGGEGSSEDEAYLASWMERIALETSGDWGKHRLGLELTASAAQEAAFGGSSLRDSKDLVQERRIIDARVFSLLNTSRFRWEFTAGSWRDEELDLSLNYGTTGLSYKGFFLKASRNRYADLGLVLPSLDLSEGLLKGWQAEAGYESRALGLTVKRDSTEGSSEMLSSKGHMSLVGVTISAETFYDMDADRVADEVLSVNIPGRCWNAEVGRSRSPDRTSWNLRLELSI